MHFSDDASPFLINAALIERYSEYCYLISSVAAHQLRLQDW